MPAMTKEQIRATVEANAIECPHCGEGIVMEMVSPDDRRDDIVTAFLNFFGITFDVRKVEDVVEAKAKHQDEQAMRAGMH